MASEIIDTNVEQPMSWVEDEWIRPDSPRLYPSDTVPAVVQKQRDLLLGLPPATDDIIPHDFIPILTLLDPAFQVPSPCPDILAAPVNFSQIVPDSNPHSIVKALKTRATMPPRSVVQRLERNMGQAWFNGDTSIIDTHYAEYPLAFWAITLWSKLHFVYKIRQDWISAEEFVRKARVTDREANIELKRISDNILEFLGVLGWHVPLAGFPSGGWRGQLELAPVEYDSPIAWTTEFIQFFRDGFLNDEAINMMVYWIQAQVRRNNNLRGTTMVGDLSFTNLLVKNFENRNTSVSRARSQLMDCEDEVKHLGLKHLWVMFNVDSSHWTTVLVDFEARSRAYGDSLPSRRNIPNPKLLALDYWLNSTFPSTNGPFKVAPNLPCDRQMDGHSCGIAACTLVSSRLGLEAPWSAKNAKLHRFQWALRLIQMHQSASPNGYVTSANLESEHTPGANNYLPMPQQAMPSEDVKTRLNPMDLAIMMNEDTTAHSLDASCLPECLGSPMLLRLDSTQTQTPPRPCPTDSPSPIDPSDLFAVDSHNEDIDNGCYVVRDGVLHFTDSDDDYIPGAGAQPPEVPVETNNPGKHPRHSSTSDSSEPPASKRRLVAELEPKAKANSDHRRAKLVGKHQDNEKSGPTGISKTAKADRERLEAAKAGRFIASCDQLHSLLVRARKTDPDARLDPTDKAGLYIICSVCNSSVQLDAPLRTSNFVKHYERCKSNGGLRRNGKWSKAAKGCPKISSMFAKLNVAAGSLSGPTAGSLTTAKASGSTRSINSSVLASKVVYCLGLRPVHHEKIQAVVDRSASGGTTHVHKIALANFGKPYSDLSVNEKASVRVAATGTAEWTVYLDPTPHIRHSDCLKTCDPLKSLLVPSDICLNCVNLLHMPSFQKAMARKPVTDSSNLKYVPQVSRQKNQAMMYLKYKGLETIISDSDSKSTTPLMQFARLVIRSKISDTSVFAGLAQSIAAKEDKLARGVGMQNIRHAPGWVDFCLIAHSISPRAYTFLKSSGFPVLEERDLRRRCSRAPSFPIGVTEQTFKLALSYLTTLGYTGPVAVGCDDTQLLSKWSPYYDGSAKKWIVLGGVGNPIEIDSDGTVEELKDYLVKATEGKTKVTKLRLWCLQPAAPQIPALILAALAIGPGMSAEDLFATHSRLIKGLLDSGICVTSYSCDGSATERKITRLFIESADETEFILIPHPEAGFTPRRIPLCFYGPSRTPIISIQDSKHALKTCRNVLFSGTHSLVIGNCVIYYEQLLELSRHLDSPVYLRDVFKVDRQDDRAALRLFSSAFVRHIFNVMKEQETSPNPHPVLSKDLTGLAVYLFVFGEFIDAFQNRFLPNIEQCRMVFRAQHFLDIWSASLATLHYPESVHFVTRDARQIIDSLIDGFVGLQVTYRDYLSHGNWPLLLHKHSTEPNEHCFAEARKLDPDFTYTGFLQMQSKLKVSIDAAALNGQYEGANARAAGYFHTEYSDKNIDIAALSCFPTDSEIHEAARLAFEEAKSLFSLCGIPVTSDLYSPAHLAASAKLPSISEWLEPKTGNIDTQPGDYGDSDDDFSAYDHNVDPLLHSAAVKLRDILQTENTRPLGPADLERKMDIYSCAAVAIEIEGRNEIDILPNQNSEDAWRAIRNQLTNSLPEPFLSPLVIANEVRKKVSRLALHEIDSEGLADLRSAHETEFAKKAIRIGKLGIDPSGTTISDNPEILKSAQSVRQKIAKVMHQTLKAIEENVGAGSGAARRLRYQGEVSTGQATGNSANAAEVAQTRSFTAMTSRIKKLENAKILCTKLVGRAGVTSLAVMQTGSIAIVLVEGKLWLAEVLTMYSKGAGKGVAHAWVESATSISGLSYVTVQLWEHWNNGEFRSMVKSTSAHHAYRFAHLQWQRLLYVTRPSLIKHLSPGRLKANATLYDIWKGLYKEEKELSNVMGRLLSRN